MIYTTTVFLTNLILAIVSIIPAVLRDNRGEIKAPKETIKAIAVCFLEGFLKTASTPDGIELINQWAAEYQAELETKNRQRDRSKNASNAKSKEGDSTKGRLDHSTQKRQGVDPCLFRLLFCYSLFESLPVMSIRVFHKNRKSEPILCHCKVRIILFWYECL